MKDVRIFRPSECRMFIDAIPKVAYRATFKALLYSGMRYIEMQRFQKHPEWFDGDFIHLPIMAIRKKKRKQLERWVRLNSTGKEIISNFLHNKDVKPLPDYKTWRDNLKRWAKRSGIDPVKLGPKTTRKTWESWLVFYYEEKLIVILKSMGHTKTTAIDHYVNLPFTEQDKRDMKAFVEGWI